MAFEIENGVLKKYIEEDGVTEVIIPDSVTSIGDHAFSDCSILESVVIPESVTSIGGNAFENCSNLKKVHINSLEAWCNIKFEDWGSNPLQYDHDLYMNGEKITELVIPDSVTSIGNYAFSGCSSLTRVVIPDSVTSIGYEAFSSCSSLKEVHINNLEAWCNIEFGGWGSNPLDYAHDLYLNSEKITELVIPDSVTSIGDWAFSGCSSLTSIVIPDSVTSIGDYAFSSCSSLTSVEIPDSVTSIGKRAFCECENLKNLVIPNSVKEIGGGAFNFTEWFENQTDDDFVIVGDGNLIRINADGDVTIPDTVKIICGESGWYSEIERIVIPDSVIKIQSLFFFDACSLHSVTFGNSLKEIAIDAFKICEIEEVYAPNPAVAELVERSTGLISSSIERDEQAEQEAEEEVYDFYIENRETWLEEIKNKKSE